MISALLRRQGRVLPLLLAVSLLLNGLLLMRSSSAPPASPQRAADCPPAGWVAFGGR